MLAVQKGQTAMSEERRAQKKGQKNMRWPNSLRTTFEHWCHERGLDEMAVIGTGFLHLARQSPAVRDAMLREYRDWESRGHPPLDDDGG